jgi:hypothetical protein
MALKCFMLSTKTATKGVENTENLKTVFSSMPKSKKQATKKIITFIKQNVNEGDEIYLFDNSLTDIIEYSEIFKQECLKIGAKCKISRWQKNIHIHEKAPEHGQYMFMEV